MDRSAVSPGGRRRPRMDVKSMYPNFHAEQNSHHVQENSTMSVPRKRRDGSSGSTRSSSISFGVGTRPPSRSGTTPNKQRVDLSQNQYASPTKQLDIAEPERQWGMRSDKQAAVAILPNSNQQDSTSAPQEYDSDVVTARLTVPSLRPRSRQVAIRGELSLTSPAAWGDNHTTPASNVGISPRLCPLPLAQTFAGGTALLESSTGRLPHTFEPDSLQDVVVNARPRTRYARRELYRQGSAPSLARISTAPPTLHSRHPLQSVVRDTATTRLNTSCSLDTLRSVSLAVGLNRRSHQGLQTGAVDMIQAVLPGTEIEGAQDDDDDTNFFLTELEAAARAASAVAAARLSMVARHIALGSFLLYGSPPALVAAIQHFTAALKTVDPAQDQNESREFDGPNRLALASLLHHHRGVALREIVVASTTNTSKTAVACIKQAFAEQQRALELAQKAKDARLQARAVKTLGLLLLDAHAYGPALAHQHEALQHALDQKDRELEARIYANLGNLALAELQFGHALSCHQRDLDLCSSKTLDCRLGRARAHRNLSIVFAKLHRRKQQIMHEREARKAEQNEGGAYLYDVANHLDNNVGNLCLQSSTPIDAALVDRVTQNLVEIVRGLSAFSRDGSALDNNDGDSITTTLEHEWNTSEIDLEAAIAALSAANVDPLAPSTVKTHLTPSTRPSTGISRHVSIRIDNYKPTASSAQL